MILSVGVADTSAIGSCTREGGSRAQWPVPYSWLASPMHEVGRWVSNISVLKLH